MNPISFPLRSFLDEQERWFLWIPVLILCGIAAYFALPFEPSLLWLALAPSFALLAFAGREKIWALIPLTALLALTLGFNAAQLETRLTARPMLNKPLEPVSMTGLLVRAEALPEGSRLTLKHPSIKDMPQEERPLYVRVKVRTAYADLPEAGERVNVWGPLWPPNDSALPSGYDFRRQAFFKQLGATGISYVEPRVYEARYPPRFFWDGFTLLFEKMRRKLNLATFAQLKDPESAMTAALLSGSQSGIAKDVMEAMRSSGLSHLLSISGVHVSMMALLVYVPLRFLFALFPWVALRWPIKKSAAVTAIAATALYTVLVGADAPTVRSALMTGIVFFAIITDRRAMSLRLVALAATVILLVTPSAAMGVSFQMSFAAVLAMVAAYEKKFDPLLDTSVFASFVGPLWAKNLGAHLRDIVTTSLIATAATTPFTIFHFQTFSFYGVIANMIAIPLTSFWIMPCLLLTYLTLPFDGAGWFIEGAGWGVSALIRLAQIVEAWPFAQIPFPPMPYWAFGVLVGGGLWLCLWRTRWRYAGLLAMALGCFYPLFATLPCAYISADKEVWAVRLHDGRMAVYGKRKEDFTTAQWVQHAGKPETLYLNEKTMASLPDELTCDESYCAYEPPPSDSPPPNSSTLRYKPTIVFLNKEASAETIAKACANDALIVVAFSPLPDCPAAQVIDGAALHERGAHTLTFEEQAGKTGLTIQTTRARRGARPWSEGWIKAPPEG